MTVSGVGSAGGFDVSKMASQMSKQMMKTSDANEDGSLDKAEFTKALTAMGVSSEDAAKKFDSIDKNNTGKISQSDIEADIKETAKSGPPSGKPPAGGVGKPSGAQGADTKNYDVKDTNKDGTVSAAEELIYDMKHATADKKSDASTNQQTQSNTAQQKVGNVVDVTV